MYTNRLLILFQTVIDFPLDGSTVSPVHNEPSTVTMTKDTPVMTKDLTSITAPMTAAISTATTGITKTSFPNQKTVINIPTHFQDSSFDYKQMR